MNPKTLRVLGRLMRYRPHLYTLSLLAWIAIGLAELAPGLIIKGFFDALTSGEPAGTSPYAFVALMIGYGVGHGSLWIYGVWIDGYFRFYISALMRRNLMADVLGKPGAAPKPQSPGEMLTTFRNDVAELENAADWTIDQAAQGIFILTAMLVLFSIDVTMTLIALVPLLAVVGIAQATMNRVKIARRASLSATQHMTGTLSEILGAPQAIQLADAAASVSAQFARVNDVRRQSVVRDTVLSQSIMSLYALSTAIGTGLVLIAAASAFQRGDFTVGDLALFISYVQMIANFLTSIGNMLTQYRQAGISMERAAQLMEINDPLPVAASAPVYIESPPPPLPALIRTPADRLESLRASGLTYRYPARDGQLNGIENVDLKLRRGQVTVVTGEIGSGKTTLVRAVLGLLPVESGEIFWNGQRVADPGAFFVPPRSAYTPQVPTLFSMTLRDNLLLGLPLDDTDILPAVRRAVFDADLESMPAGLDTLVGVKGTRLSGGQVQRAAATRMFLRAPELLVFDDLSSALDVQTERLLWSRLFSGERPTCLVVSHRRAVLRLADQIVVLKAGRVIDTGTLDDLLPRCDDLRRIWEGGAAE